MNEIKNKQYSFFSLYNKKFNIFILICLRTYFEIFLYMQSDDYVTQHPLQSSLHIDNKEHILFYLQ